MPRAAAPRRPSRAIRGAAQARGGQRRPEPAAARPRSSIQTSGDEVDDPVAEHVLGATARSPACAARRRAGGDADAWRGQRVYPMPTYVALRRPRSAVEVRGWVAHRRRPAAGHRAARRGSHGTRRRARRRGRLAATLGAEGGARPAHRRAGRPLGGADRPVGGPADAPAPGRTRAGRRPAPPSSALTRRRPPGPSSARPRTRSSASGSTALATRRSQWAKVRVETGRASAGRSGSDTAMDAQTARQQLAEVRRRYAMLRERTRQLRDRRSTGTGARGRRPRELPESLAQEFGFLQADFAELERRGRAGEFNADAHTLFRERSEAFVAQLHAWEEAEGGGHADPEPTA